MSSPSSADSEPPGIWSDRPTLVDDIELPMIPGSAKTAKNRALLTVLTGPLSGSVYRVPKSISTIGRSEDADVCILDPSLSRIHARIVCEGGNYALLDAGSTNGTFVDESPISGSARLVSGSRLRLGKRTIVSFSLHDELEETAALSLREAALRDRLTGAYNRGVFDDRLNSELAFARRHAAPLSLLLLDVDHFKSFNDKHGHQVGDAVLSAVGRKIQATVRTEDVVARYGGEEFAVIARATPLEKSLILGERLRSAISELEVPSADTSVLSVTASIGVSTWTETLDLPASGLVAEADRALYVAKRSGRNRVSHASQTP